METKTKNVIGNLVAFIKHPFNRKNEPLLHTIEWIFVLFAFFAIGMPVIYYQSTGNNFGGGKLSYIGNKPAEAPPTAEEKMFLGETITEPLVDITGWDIYENQYYGFQIKHPKSWENNTQYKTATGKSARYTIMYKFRKNEEDSNNVFDGYDVKIYLASKVQGVESTNDIHKKGNISEDIAGCKVSEEEVKFNDLDLKKVSIGQDNPCYEPAYFYTITKGDYIYNIVPAVGESGARYAEPEATTDKMFPEYKEAVKSFDLISIKKPKAVVPVRPKITASRPVSAKVVNGRLVCAKKHDKPGKSTNGNKPGHMDMECCLDPDETPNPWCTYSNPIYQKYLK